MALLLCALVWPACLPARLPARLFCVFVLDVWPRRCAPCSRLPACHAEHPCPCPSIPRQLSFCLACLLLQEGWLGAELWDASRQLDAACEAYTAWQPAAEQLLAVAGQGEEDMVPETPRSRCAGGGEGWVWHNLARCSPLPTLHLEG